MKTINYTGSSKLISRIVALLNGKAPLPVDADDNVDWGTSGQVLTTDGSGATAWTNSSAVGQTYTMSLSDHTLSLTDGDGNVQTVTLPDDDTTYTMAVSGTTLTLTDSAGNVQTVTLQDTTYTAGDGIDITSDVISLEYFSVVNGKVCITYTE